MSMNDQSIQTSSNRLGWSEEEDALLFDTVREARALSAPLKAVFDKVAEKTGRKPNSIRNYYYARVKQGGDGDMELPHNPAFVPFSNDEIEALLKTVLGAQARGVSVRACTLEMGRGDNRAMLRYQNKYRSLLKSNPALVRRVVEDMKRSGEITIDPFESKLPVRRAGRPRKQGVNLLDVVGDVVEQLDRVEGLDVSAFFESLGALAVSAAKGVKMHEKLQSINGLEDAAAIVEENAELKARLNEQKTELAAQRERFTMLLGYFRQLMDVNREFLGMTSVTKVSSLSSYIRELARNVEDCEKWMLESK
ncbi:hypothetical protein LJC27_04875 [Christensenellaceae bacterium OttesenSCG-928-M15]|nr:hypothetical protein [Christensenellaceae bacterium OttesenSCG-928-M15]